MAINSDAGICNLSLGYIGNKDTVSNIQTPTNDKETVFATWYDVTRQSCLKMLMPNFALSRRVVAQLAEVPATGYAYYYEYPAQCLKLLGIGDIMDRENNYSVEDGKIATDEVYEDGMPIRFIKDITDVTLFSPEFKLVFAMQLASNTALQITQDVAKANLIKSSMREMMSSVSGVNAQENRPVRISRSRFKDARFMNDPSYTGKR